ncbi:Putative sensory transduction regulator [Thermus arciformis]|uniref:Putative sensory transduction regulator n=1 Tax=Thermus arciformis TaxID=482827 RepID=A0A1G7JGS0_9DEIN|nr:YbjN domain-containing protein [Thermus arciformis]SDF24130.1 Putative sensory transduction regulator [Thermus arciformis]
MRAFLAVLAVLGLALAQGVVKGLTPAEVERVLKQANLAYEKTEAQEFRLEMAGLTKVWLFLDYCQEERCGVLTLSAGFTLDEVPDLEAINAWNRDRRFSRAFLGEDGTVWVESDLDLTGGVSLGAVAAFLDLFAEEILPDFMDHIGFEP